MVAALPVNDQFQIVADDVDNDLGYDGANDLLARLRGRTGTGEPESTRSATRHDALRAIGFDRSVRADRDLFGKWATGFGKDRQLEWTRGLAVPRDHGTLYPDSLGALHTAFCACSGGKSGYAGCPAAASSPSLSSGSAIGLRVDK